MSSRKKTRALWGQGQITLLDVGEGALLERIKKGFAQTSDRVALGIGDDAAVLKDAGRKSVFCQDTLVENIDFRRTWASPKDLGHKAAAVNLSDLAAMGAEPWALSASLALPASTTLKDAMAILRAIHRYAEQFGAALVGGDLSATEGPIVLSVSALGKMHGKRVLKRGCARLGDQILVSGTLGDAGAGLLLLEQGLNKPKQLIRKQLRPVPQVALGKLLVEMKSVRACTDISDGLDVDAENLLGSGQHIHWFEEKIPMAPVLIKHFGHEKSLQLAFFGGEDFELVFACAPKGVDGVLKKAAKKGIRLSVVGEVRKDAQKNKKARIISAYEHFRV